MNLLVDIGNTSIGLAFKEESKTLDKFHLTCDKSKSIDEYVRLFEAIFGKKYIEATIKHIVISSVVPLVLQILSETFKRLYPLSEQIVVRPGIKTGVLFKIDNINELGADLVCDTVGLKEKYHSNVIGVDLGTASKFLYVNARGEFEGCSIAPGLVNSIKSLCKGTSLLPEIDIALPKNIVGKNTSESIKSGAVLGHALMIKSLCDAYEKEAGVKLTRVITGGYSHILKDYFIELGFVFDEDLIFDGLMSILNRNTR